MAEIKVASLYVTQCIYKICKSYSSNSGDVSFSPIKTLPACTAVTVTFVELVPFVTVTSGSGSTIL